MKTVDLGPVLGSREPILAADHQADLLGEAPPEMRATYTAVIGHLDTLGAALPSGARGQYWSWIGDDGAVHAALRVVPS